MRAYEPFQLTAGQLQGAGLGLDISLKASHSDLVGDGLDGDEVRKVNYCSFLRL